MLPVACGLVIILASGCDLFRSEEDDGSVEGVDFEQLFAPPTPSEIAAVEFDWAGRVPSPLDVNLILEQGVTSGGWSALLRIYSHRVDAVLHYGAVLVPSIEPDRSRPVLLFLHGGDAGVSIDEVAFVVSLSPDLRDEFIIVVPSFRSEAISFGVEEYRSDGPPSPWDRDVDDALALLSVALEEVPTADADRVAVLGFSRGAAVGLLASIRDPRIDGIVDFFGPTDFLGPFAQVVFREALEGDLRPLPGVEYLNETIAQPLKDEELSIEDARIELIRRSPIYFTARLPMLQIHHGLNDEIVPAAESEALASALDDANNPMVDLFLYDGGEHDPLTLQGSMARATTFLLEIANPVSP